MNDISRHSVSVAGIVLNERGEVLAIKRRDNGEWQPPGGVLELGETIEDGLRREILEETGVDASVGPLTGVYKNMRLGVIALVFRCHFVGGRMRTSDETQELRWLPAQEAQALMTPIFAARVRDALEDHSASARIRSHDGTGSL